MGSLVHLPRLSSLLDLGPDARNPEEDREDFRTLVRLVFSPGEASALKKKQDEYEGQTRLDNRMFFALLAFKNDRDALQNARERFQREDLLTAAFDDVSAFVPTSFSVDTMARPSLSFIVYNLDGRAIGGDEIVIDYVFAAKQGADALQRFIAHEVHHLVRQRLTQLTRPGLEVAERDIVRTLDQVQSEGIADNIDKPEIVFSDDFRQQFEQDTTRAGQWMARTFKRYAETFRSEDESTPSTLAKIDSLLVRAVQADDRGDDDAVRKHAEEIWESLAYAGHPNGYYMANQIDDVRNVIANPFEFVYRYNDAVCGSDDEAHCFSDEAIQYLRVLEDRHYG